MTEYDHKLKYNIGKFWAMHFFSIDIMFIPKNRKVSNPIGKKYKGQMTE